MTDPLRYIVFGTDDPSYVAIKGGDNAFTGQNSFADQITLVGSGRVKKEIFIPISTTTKGVSAPTDALRAIGASGSIKIPVLQFSKTSMNETHFIVHMPSDVDGSVNVQFHLMWIPGASWSSGNYLWNLDYLVKDDVGASVSTGTPTTIVMDVTPSNATTLLETEFTDTIDVGPDQIIYCRLWRDVADNADDVGSPFFAEFEYTANTLGEAT